VTVEPRDVVVIGGSAGSLEPLRELAAALVAQAGGLVLVQEPGDAAHPSMPRAAQAAAPGAIALPGRKLGEVVSGCWANPGSRPGHARSGRKPRR
jgi:two-component system chemotaxis response regulator CheB